MTTINELLHSIKQSDQQISLKTILEIHPTLGRRTAQRWLKQLLDDSKIKAEGKGPSRVYSYIHSEDIPDDSDDQYPSYIPLSADSRDILTFQINSLL